MFQENKILEEPFLYRPMLGVKVIYMWKLCGIIQKHSRVIVMKQLFGIFLTTTRRSCSLVKLHVWIYHVNTWRRFDNDTTSMLHHIYFVSTLKQFCLSKGMQLNAVKSIFLGFWALGQSIYCNVEKVSENIYFVFYILYNAFQILLDVDTNQKILIVSHSSSWVLQCTAP